jgi:hypothetical protein
MSEKLWPTPGSCPVGVITFPSTLTKERAEQLRELWLRTYDTAGSRATVFGNKGKLSKQAKKKKK